ncbi:DNA/RNA nuclease SfsA [Candidatus Micrarchaeota archaeon]|nr:DNA/RNA nuclease SfsA [Candidatus Micrarchaeota archaeon]
MKKPAYRFPEELAEGIILSRPNRFIMMVRVGRRTVRCHCPNTGRIGDIIFKDVPCLLSKSARKERKTKYTVEAISLDPPSCKNKRWIGINQTRANEYLAFFIRNNALARMAGKGKLEREKPLGRSRIDFVIGGASGNTYMEVKTPLISLPASKSVKTATHSRFDSFERLIKHFADLARSVRKGSRAIVLLCYLYDAPRFRPPAPDRTSSRIQRAARLAERSGVGNWQVNLRIDERGVSLIRYVRLKLW